MAGDPQQPVPVGDLEIAQRIASAARSGGRAEREPTLEQLLGAFDEHEPTSQARTRVASALTLAGMRVAPSVHEAHPGERIRLRPPAGGGRARPVLGLGAVLAVVGAAAAVAALTGGGSNNDSASSALPATATTATTATHEITVTTGPAPRPAAKPKARPKATKPRPKPKPKPAAPTQVVVRLVPGAQPSYLCVDHGPGTPTIETTLASPQTFRGARVRLNVGLSSVRVTVNGKPFALAGSPSGYDISVKNRAYLPQGQRPCG